MARSGTETRERILDAAESLVLDKGLAATSIDEILSESSTSKGSFFHHFPSKNHLARALLERYATADTALLADIMARAETMTDDPARQVLAFLKLFEEVARDTVSQQPSCLYVSYIFEGQLFANGTNDIISGAFMAWRETLAAKLREAVDAHPPRAPVDLDALADHVSATYEGAFMMSSAMNDPELMRRQLELVRRQIAILFDVPA